MGINNGFDLKVLSDIMIVSFGCNWIFEFYNLCFGVMEIVLVSNDYKLGFMVDLMVKDLGFVMEVV